MTNVSNFSGRDYARKLEGLLGPLKQVSQLSDEKWRGEYEYNRRLEKAKSHTVYVIISVIVGLVFGGKVWALTSMHRLALMALGSVIAMGYYLSDWIIVQPAIRRITQNKQKYCEEMDARIIETLEPCMSELREYVPKKYRYYQAVATMYGYLMDGRADSWKEAMNLFEVTQHQQRMEHHAQLQAGYAAAAADNSRIAAEATQEIARNSFWRIY